MRIEHLALALTLCGTASADGGGTFVPRASLSIARQEVGAARIGDSVYVVGGLIQGFNTTATVEVYDLANDSWSFAPPLPAPRHHMMVAAVGTQLYVIGGYPGPFSATDDVFVFDTQTNAWSTGPSLPSARAAAWAVTIGTRIYVAAGTNAAGQATASLFILDTQTDAWSQGADMQVGREHNAAAVLNGRMHVAGGRAGPATASHESYDPATNTWTTLAPMPTARSATATAAFGGRLFVMGGEVPMLFDVNEVYDPVNDRWTVQAPMPVARHGIAAVPIDGGILLPAGGTVQGLQPSDFCDVFIPEPFAAARMFCTCAGGGACGNSDADAGCANSTGAGATLETCGSASVAGDDLVLIAAGVPVAQFGIVFMGTAETSIGLGDGVRCVDFGPGGLFRFPVRVADAGGVFQEGPGIVGFTLANNPAAGHIQVGATWNFQAWYRDPGGCGSGSNLTNAIGVRFVP